MRPRRPSSPALPAVVALTAALVGGGEPAGAVDVLTRTLTAHDGLPGSWITALAVDPDGRLWMAGPAGIARLQGAVASPLPGTAAAHYPVQLLTRRDRVVVRDALGDVFELEGGSLAPVPGPDGGPLVAEAAAMRPDGALLGIVDGDVWSQDASGRWELALPGQGRSFDAIFYGGADTLLLAGDDRWWTWRPGAAPTPLVDARPRNRHAVVDARGTIWLMDGNPARVRATRGDGFHEVWRDDRIGPHRGFAVQDGVLWVGDDGFVHAVHPDGRREVFGAPGAPHPARGPWLADVEGNLWSGGSEGLTQIPSPGLRIYTARDGLPSNTTRAVVVADDHLLVSTWEGISRLDIATGTAAPAGAGISKGYLCTDAEGTTWGRTIGDDGAPRYVGLYAAGDLTFPAPAGTHHLYGCARASTGDVWIADAGQLARTAGRSVPPRILAAPPVPARGIHQVLEDRSGRVWVSSGRTVCHTATTSLDAGDPAWTCEEVPCRYAVDDLHETDAGTIWAVERTSGVFARGPAGFVALRGNVHLPSRNLRRVVASPRGGQWVLGASVAVRVAEAADHPDGWVVLERLPAWLGATLASVVDLHEADDGGLWLASHGGVVRIPASARDLPRPPPQVRLDEIRVDGARVDPDDVVVPPGGRASVRWWATTLRAPGLLRYRSRLDDGGWSEPSVIPGVEVDGAVPGTHTLEIAASADGETWTDPPLTLRWRVPVPWWSRPIVWMSALFGVAASIAAAVQVRATLLVREARRRERLAMDLHDEVGAGLASIGLLAGAADDPDLDPEAVRALTTRIATEAEDLGGSVAGLVWSLRRGTQNARSLADFIEQRAGSLFPHLATSGDLHRERSPDLTEDVQLDIAVLRAIQLAALEALHNAARHAAATEVWIETVREGRWLTVRITDDGCGFDPDTVTPAPDHGLGLQSMRTRMAEVGGACTITPRPEGGTTVTLRAPARR